MTNERAINVLRGQESAYWGTLSEDEHKAFDLAVDALTAKQPRVMTLEEVLERQPFHLWVEEIGMEPQVFPVALVEDIYRDAKFDWAVDKATLLNDEDYGKCWRFWSVKPTDEQRKATPWNEPPKEDEA